jgi:hypothetical protein
MISRTRVKGAMIGFDGAGIIIAYVVALGLIIFKNSIQRLILLMFGFLGVIITSRTGAVVFIGVSLFYYSRQFINNKKVFLKEIIILGTIITTLAIVVFTVFSESAFVSKSLHSSFEFIYSYQKTGHAKISSLNDTLQNHMIVTKEDLSLFGHPQRQRWDTTTISSAAQSDCGYLQVLANFGLPNVFLILFVHLYLIYLIYIPKKNIFDMRLITTFLFLIAAIKGPYFFARMTYDLILFIIFIQYVELKEKKEITEFRI